MSLRSFWRSRSGRDFGALVLLAVIGPLLIVRLYRWGPVVDRFHRWLHLVDPVYLLDAIVVFAVVAVGGMLYGVRRWLDLVREIRRRKVAEAEVRHLRGLIPICSFCRLIRDPDGHWHSLEQYLEEHSDARLTHGMCPGCAKTRWLQ